MTCRQISRLLHTSVVVNSQAQSPSDYKKNVLSLHQGWQRELEICSVPVTPNKERTVARLQEHSSNSDKKAELWLWANGTMDYHTWVNSRRARSWFYKHPLSHTSASWFLTQYTRYGTIKSERRSSSNTLVFLWSQLCQFQWRNESKTHWDEYTQKPKRRSIKSK